MLENSAFWHTHMSLTIGFHLSELTVVFRKRPSVRQSILETIHFIMYANNFLLVCTHLSCGKVHFICNTPQEQDKSHNASTDSTFLIWTIRIIIKKVEHANLEQAIISFNDADINNFWFWFTRRAATQQFIKSICIGQIRIRKPKIE